jgi:hypothetical protein
VRSSIAASPTPDIARMMTERYGAYRRIYPALRAIERAES